MRNLQISGEEEDQLFNFETVMEALGGGNGGFLGWNFLQRKNKRHNSRRRNSKFSDSVEATRGTGYRFPLKPAATAGSLALTGDTIAQLIERWKKEKALKPQSLSGSDQYEKDVLWATLLDHDWVRALRMTSYGFLLYGPGSYAWYQYLDCCMPKQTVQNVMLKVLLNQILLGPCVIAACFAQFMAREAGLRFRRSIKTMLCPHYVLGGPSSSSCSFHVNGLHILEFLFIINYEQVISFSTGLSSHH